MTEVLNSGCVMALITCLNNIKKSTKSTACIFDCLRSITRQDAAKLDFIRHEGVAAVARHLVDSFRELSKQRNIVDLEHACPVLRGSVCLTKGQPRLQNVWAQTSRFLGCSNGRNEA